MTSALKILKRERLTNNVQTFHILERRSKIELSAGTILSGAKCPKEIYSRGSPGLFPEGVREPFVVCERVIDLRRDAQITRFADAIERNFDPKLVVEAQLLGIDFAQTT